MNKQLITIVLGFLLVISLMDSVIISGLNKVERNNEILKTEQLLLNRKASLVFNMREVMFKRVTLLRNAFLLTDAFDLDASRMEFFALALDVIRLRDQLLVEKILTEEHKIINAFLAIASKGTPIQNQIFDLLIDGQSIKELEKMFVSAFQFQNEATDILSTFLSSLQEQRQQVVITVLEKNDETISLIWKTTILTTILALLIVIYVVTSNRKQNKKLEEALDKAKFATIAKSQFLATMSHEIRTPMNGVLGMAELLSETELNKHQLDYVNTIKNSGDTLLTIINDILDFSKVEANKLELSFSSCNIKQLFEDVLALLKTAIDPESVELSLNYDVSNPTQFIADAGRIRQILINVIGNAIKFTHQGYVKVSVTSNKTIQDNFHLLTISIEDSGIGISKSDQRKLFQSFTQADSSTNRNYGGTGLGLAICKLLIEKMKGKIQLKRMLNKGSTFIIELPLEISTANLSQTEHPNLQGKTDGVIPSRDYSKVNIILAEDNKINQKVTLTILKKLGVIADLAENGQSLIEKLTQKKYDLVLMDCQMPIVDGYQATKQIRTKEASSDEDKPMTIIALTANAFEEDKKKCIDAGMDDYLSKPFKQHDLEEKLAYWLKDN